MPPPRAHSPESEPGPWFFCLRHDVHPGAIGIAMVGELDIAAAADARDVIARAQADARVVICDLHDVSFIDSSGLQVLLDATARARRHNARLTLANPSTCVRRLIDLVGLKAAGRRCTTSPTAIARQTAYRQPSRSVSLGLRRQTPARDRHR